jgi:hypothetical protein
MSAIQRTTRTPAHIPSSLDTMRRIGSSMAAPLRRVRSAVSAAIARDQLGRIDEIEVGRGTGARI